MSYLSTPLLLLIGGFFIMSHFEWVYGEWSACNRPCDGGEKKRKVECEFVLRPTVFHMVSTLLILILFTFNYTSDYMRFVFGIISLSIVSLYIYRIFKENQQILRIKMEGNLACQLNPLTAFTPLLQTTCNTLPCIHPEELYYKYIGNVNSLSATGEDYMNVVPNMGLTQLDCANFCEQKENCYTYGYIDKDEDGKFVGICHLYNRPYRPEEEYKISHQTKWQNYFVGYRNEYRTAESEKTKKLPPMQFVDDSENGEMIISIGEFSTLSDTLYPSFESPSEKRCAEAAWGDTRAAGYQWDTSHHICQIFSRETYAKMQMGGRGSVYKNIKVILKEPGGLYQPED